MEIYKGYKLEINESYYGMWCVSLPENKNFYSEACFMTKDEAKKFVDNIERVVGKREKEENKCPECGEEVDLNKLGAWDGGAEYHCGTCDKIYDYIG